MKIVVCIKQVPETTNVKIDEKTKNIDRRGLGGVINSYDLHALETALEIKRNVGGEVITLTMGPDDFAVSLRETLALGADSSVLLSDRAFAGADTLATGYVLGKAIKKIGDVDLVILGQQSVDADTGQVGPIMAELLQVPQVTYANEVTAQDNKLVIKRNLDNVAQEITAQLPLLLTVTDTINQPKYTNVVEITKSFAKPITTWHASDLQLDSERVGQAGSPTIVRSISSPEKTAKVGHKLADDPMEAAKELVTALKKQNMLAEED
ncbi:electron transfer flavoprotein subunit beta/FixA family protein [Companilactobacillus zhachilii]|jgi:Electron transfer flavoprotein, beta subunit|uniref:Electron transfer flavoprotein small subunit n=1 Tax=Companilactobacillus zhachilii TaxID=2304606 RepID=A0A386PRY6_9LACO|nr:electron transfer flavoprotein subunit beta/FixA family protein [Companilactobacillus zhachilii]AYE37463.1 electron transfer flavoprotein beta subunit/FixA family protein [Companilactobacillus zhachilii]MBL3530984.1 electron transfer flavoprotein subunit beta/FixA family protein [Companilactobacillus zhachilii]